MVGHFLIVIIATPIPNLVQVSALMFHQGSKWRIFPLDMSLTSLKRDTGGIDASENDTIIKIAFIDINER